MLTKRAKWVVLIATIFGIWLTVFGCANLAENFSTKDPSEKLPIRTLSIQIDEDQREELFSQLQIYSAKYGLKFYLSFYEGKRIFFVVMYGEGFHISALSKSVNTTELDIDFLEEDPTNPPSQATIDELYDDLKAFIRVIPGVVIVPE
jgi:hypothetical protein